MTYLDGIYNAEGKFLNYTPSGADVSAGEFVSIAGRCGMVAEDISDGV